MVLIHRLFVSDAIDEIYLELWGSLPRPVLPFPETISYCFSYLYVLFGSDTAALLRILSCWFDAAAMHCLRATLHFRNNVIDRSIVT